MFYFSETKAIERFWKSVVGNVVIRCLDISRYAARLLDIPSKQVISCKDTVGKTY